MQRSQNLPIERIRGKNKWQSKQKHIFLANVLKEEKKETQILTTHKTFKKTHIVQQAKHQLRLNINGEMVFELQGMKPLIDKLQAGEKNKNYKIIKSLWNRTIS